MNNFSVWSEKKYMLSGNVTGKCWGLLIGRGY